VWNIAANSTPYNYTFWPYSINETNLTLYNIQADACRSGESDTDSPQTSTQDSQRSYSGYYWQDSAWNTTWWTHFYQDPYSTDWESWGFPPSMPASFECVAENGVYQVISLSPCLCQITHSDELVGLLIRMAFCSHNC
jgi:hypothetical protein